LVKFANSRNWNRPDLTDFRAIISLMQASYVKYIFYRFACASQVDPYPGRDRFPFCLAP